MNLEIIKQDEILRDSIKLKSMLQMWRDLIKKLRGVLRREAESHYLVIVRKVVNWNIVILKD